jgi:hypothetical protein
MSVPAGTAHGRKNFLTEPKAAETKFLRTHHARTNSCIRFFGDKLFHSIKHQEENDENTFAIYPGSVGNRPSHASPRQEPNTVDPEVRQEIEAVTKRREEAFNKHDAAAWSAFYTEFAIDVWSFQAEGAAVGLPAIKKSMRPILHLTPHGSHSRLFRYMPSPIKYVRSWTTLITNTRRARL